MPNENIKVKIKVLERENCDDDDVVVIRVKVKGCTQPFTCDVTINDTDGNSIASATVPPGPPPAATRRRLNNYENKFRHSINFIISTPFVR